MFDARVLERFWAKVDKRGPDECWPWTGFIPENAYGMMSINGGSARAHRVSWMIANDQSVPADLYICHRCHNKACVNPAHLYAGSPHQNITDMMEAGRQHNQSLTHCKSGHPLAGANLRMRSGDKSSQRVCRECHRNHRLKTAKAKAWAKFKAANGPFLDLLAIIHRDGGHYVEEHGLDKAIADATHIAAALTASSHAKREGHAEGMRDAAEIADAVASRTGLTSVGWAQINGARRIAAAIRAKLAGGGE